MVGGSQGAKNASEVDGRGRREEFVRVGPQGGARMSGRKARRAAHFKRVHHLLTELFIGTQEFEVGYILDVPQPFFIPIN